MLLIIHCIKYTVEYIICRDEGMDVEQHTCLRRQGSRADLVAGAQAGQWIHHNRYVSLTESSVGFFLLTKPVLTCSWTMDPPQ
jgi:hypothetical protein